MSLSWFVINMISYVTEFQASSVSNIATAHVPKLSGIKVMGSKNAVWRWCFLTWGNATIFSRQVLCLTSFWTEERQIRRELCDSVRKWSFIIVPRKFPGALNLLSSDRDTCAANHQMNSHVNEYSQHKTAVIKKDMIFIWYGNVYTYALQFINYS